MVELAFYGKHNVRANCAGPMVKAVHAELVLESTLWTSNALKVLNEVIRDGPKHTFAADSFRYLNAACQARHDFISWLIQGSPAAETSLCLARERNKTPDKVI